MKEQINGKKIEEIVIIRNFKHYLLNKILNVFGDNLVSVVLFGSQARNSYSEYSDVDVIVVVENYDENEKALSALTMGFVVDMEKTLDILIFSKEDIIKNFEHISPLFSTLLLGKKILFDKEMFFYNEFKKFVLEMVNEKIKYCEGGKIWEMNKIAKDLEILL